MENKTFSVVTFAVLIEAIITYMNQFFIEDGFCWKMLLSIILGMTVAVAYKLDLPAYKLDLPAYFNLKSDIPYIGCILTGILISRGSNYVFDLLEKLSI